MIATAIAFGAGALVGTAGIYAGYKLGFDNGYKFGTADAKSSMDSLGILSRLASSFGSGFDPFKKPEPPQATEETPE